MRPDLCHRLSHLFVLFEFGTVPESRVDRGSRGWGGLFGGGGCQGGCGLQKPPAVWSAV